jgi:hypothetical protein
VCGIREFTFPDGSVRRLFVCFLITRKDHPEATASLCVYNNRCTSCTYNMRLPSSPGVTRDSTAAIAANRQHLAAMDNDSSAEEDVATTISTVMARVIESGLHVFNNLNGHASWSLKYRTGIDVFDTVRNPGHTIELGVVLKVQQATMNKMDQIAKAAPRNSNEAELHSFVSARLALLYSLHPHFLGVRKPNGDVLDKLRNSKLLATESLSLAPLLLLAIRGIEALRPAANLLIVVLQVCSFAYAPEATERMIAAWDTELQALSSRLQTDALLLPPKKVAKPKQTKEHRKLRAKTNQLTKEIHKLKVRNKELLYAIGEDDDNDEDDNNDDEGGVANPGAAPEQRQKGTDFVALIDHSLHTLLSTHLARNQAAHHHASRSAVQEHGRLDWRCIR